MNNQGNNDKDRNMELSWSETPEETNYVTEENDKEDRKRRFIAFIKAFSMMLLTLVVLVFAGIAWFTMNSKVSTDGMNIKVAGMPFELAVPDTENIGSISYIQSGTKEHATYDSGTALNDMPGGAHALDGEWGTYSYIADLGSGTVSSGSFYTTVGGDSIKWRLTDPENTDGLGPDSSGRFMFYIVPKVNGDLNVKLKLSIEGYSAAVSRNENSTFRVQNLAKIEPDDPNYSAVSFLNSHILYFEDWTGAHAGATEPYYYRSLVQDDTLEINLTNCVVDRLIPVTIYWIWPNTFAQLTCIAANGNIANSSSGAVQEDIETVALLRNYTIDNRYTILKSNLDMLNKMSSSGTFDPEKAAQNVEDLSLAYNLADQEIGTKIQYFLLTLSAE